MLPGSSARSTPRRRFLGHVAGGAVTLAAGALAGRDLAAQQGAGPAAPSPASRPAPLEASPWDMSWVERVKGKHRQVFDAPEIADATVLHQASTWMRDYASVYGTRDDEMTAVLVIRHSAIPMILDDELWKRLELGAKWTELSDDKKPIPDPETGEPALRNPFLNANAGNEARHSMLWPDGGLDTLIARGAVVLGCDLALGGLTGLLMQAEGMKREEASRTVREHLLPGVTVMPSGIFAVTRAQEEGCQYLRAT